MSLLPRTVDVEGFRQALGSAATHVNVITAREQDGQPIGMTATAFSSVSADPLLVLICVNRENRTYSRILRSGLFGVNILSGRAQEISAFCARPQSDKVLKDEWLSDNGRVWSAPALSDALAFLDCEVYRDLHAGTHAVILGAVRGIGLPEEGAAEAIEPLLYFRGSYHGLGPVRTLHDAPVTVG